MAAPPGTLASARGRASASARRRCNSGSLNGLLRNPAAPACTKTVPLVTAGTTYTYECVGPAPITGRTTNGFTATGSAQATSTSTLKVPLTGGITATDPKAPAVDVSNVSIVKSVDKPFANVGEQVTFSFKITNTGTAALNTVALTDPDDDLPESRWTGGKLALGEALLDLTLPTIRCVVPSRAQPGLDVDRGITRALSARTERCLGSYCWVVEAGDVRVGDEVGVRPAGATTRLLAGSARHARRITFGMVTRTLDRLRH